MKKRLFSVSILLMMGFGCQQMDWNNPLDSKTEANADAWAPKELTVTVLNDQEAHLEWQGSDERTEGYHIYRAAGKGAYIIRASDSLKTYIDTALTVGESYTYKIAAIAGKNESSPSDTVRIVTEFPGVTQLSVLPVTDVLMHVSWKLPETYQSVYTIEGLNIERKGESGDYTLLKTIAAQDTVAFDSTITLGQVYQYRLSAYNRINSSAYTESNQSNSTFPAPTNLTAEALDDQSIQLTWTDNCTFESGYRLERDGGNGFTQIAELGENITEYTDSGLNYGTNYQYRVRAYSSLNVSEYSNQDGATMIIPTPSNLSAEALDDQSISLTWTDNCNYELGYRLERDSGSGFEQIAELGENVTDYTDSGLNYSTSYQYRVRAYTSLNVSEYSNQDGATMIIPAPSNLTAEALDDQSIHLTWTDNCTFESGYRLERNSSGSGFEQITELGENITEYTDSGLNYGIYYQYRVRAITSLNASEYVTLIGVETIFPAPTNLTAEALDDQSIQLSWTDNCTFESGYRLERDGGSGFEQIAELGENITEYTDSGLTYSTSYQYRVRAFTSLNVSEYSNQDGATMIIPVPSNLSAEALDDQSIELTWTDNCTFELGYRLERDSGSGFEQIAELGENITEFTDNGLTYGDSYQYRVSAFTANYTSGYSNEALSIWMGTVTDIEGNVYTTVKIGNQWWMAENLKVTYYRDGTPIPNVTDNTSWKGLSTGAYCYYSNSSVHGETYGALYNWYAVNDAHGLAPEGWHVPTDEEWTELVNYLGGSSVAGKKLKSATDWDGMDIAGFGALPGGWRHYSTGGFNYMGFTAHFWSSSENDSNYAWHRRLSNDVDRLSYLKTTGFSVRCVRDVE
jgi:uncharacterized protein